MDYNMRQECRLDDIVLGLKLTDVTVEALRLLTLKTGVEYITPAVLATTEWPEATIPSLSLSSKTLLIVHLGQLE